MQIVLARVFPPSIDNHHKAAGVGLSGMQGQTSFPPPQVAEVSENSTNRTFLTGRDYDRNAATKDVPHQLKNDGSATKNIQQARKLRPARILASFTSEGKEMGISRHPRLTPCTGISHDPRASVWQPKRVEHVVGCSESGVNIKVTIAGPPEEHAIGDGGARQARSATGEAP